MQTAPEELLVDPYSALSEGAFWFWDYKIGGFSRMLYDWPLVIFGVALAFALVGKREYAKAAFWGLFIFSVTMSATYWLGPFLYGLVIKPGAKAAEGWQTYAWPVLGCIAMSCFVSAVFGVAGYGLGWLSKKLFLRKLRPPG